MTSFRRIVNNPYGRLFYDKIKLRKLEGNYTLEKKKLDKIQVQITQAEQDQIDMTRAHLEDLKKIVMKKIYGEYLK